VRAGISEPEVQASGPVQRSRFLEALARPAGAGNRSEFGSPIVMLEPGGLGSASQARCPRFSGTLRAMMTRHLDGSRLRSGLVALLALGCAVSFGAGATAAEVETTLTVEVTEVPLGVVGIEAGDRFDLHFTIDDAVVDTNASVGAGAFPNLVTSFTASAGPANVGSWDPSGGSFDAGASNFVSNAFGDNFTLQFRGSGFPAAGAPFFDFELRFVWPAGIVDSGSGEGFALQLGVAPGALDLTAALAFGAIRFQVGEDSLDVLVEEAEPFADLLVWPGSSPCNGSFEICIAAAPPGGTVEIASDGPIDSGFLSIEKSLTVRAGAGFEPTFAPFSSFFAGPLGAGDHHVRFEGLRFENGSIRVFQNAAGALDVAVVDNIFEASPNGGPAIELSANAVTGPVEFAFEDNRVVVPDRDDGSQGIVAFPGGAVSMEGVIRGNRITMGSNTQGAAVSLPNDASTFNVDVFANVIDGSGYQEGISVFSFGPGSVAARLADNVVSGTAGEGSREAITVYASMGAIEALIVNNTLAENQTAIAIGGRPDLGGSFDGLVANNAIVGNERGLNVDPGAGTIPDRNNLYFDNTHDLGDGETPALPGPNSIFGMDPLFVASSDFRPDAASPLVDAGDTAAVPFDLTSDVTGGPRILGGIVDIGAHEVPEPSGPLAAGAAAAALAALARFRAPRSTASGRRAAGGSDAYLRHPQPVQAGPTRRHRRAQTDLAFGPWHPPRGRTPRRGRAGQRVESSHGLGTRSAALHAER
jgi:hypothetical protein